MTTFVKIKAEVKWVVKYGCIKCGRTADGETTRTTANVTTALDLVKTILRKAHRPDRMPVGWGHFSDGYRCETCVKETANEDVH